VSLADAVPLYISCIARPLPGLLAAAGASEPVVYNEMRVDRGPATGDLVWLNLCWETSLEAGEESCGGKLTPVGVVRGVALVTEYVP